MDLLIATFKKADTDGNGFLSWEEVINVFITADICPSVTTMDTFQEKINCEERGVLRHKIVLEVRTILM